MSAPVITSVDVIYPDGQDHISPGQTAEIVVHATDPDSVQVEVQVTVRDSSGTPTTGTAIVVQSDPLTFEASAEGATVTADPTAPGRFYVTIPSV